MKLVNDFKKHTDEILLIMKIFKYDFTDKTLPIATASVNDGFSITDELIIVIRNKQGNK